MNNNDKLTKLIRERSDIGEFSLVRYVYIIENEKQEFLLGKSDTDSSLSHVLDNMWEIFSESYFSMFMISENEDLLETASESIKNFTRLEIDPVKIQLKYLSYATHAIEYYDEQLHLYPPRSGIQKEEFKVLYLYYYAKAESSQNFEFWSDWHNDEGWYTREEALKILDLETDRYVLEHLQKLEDLLH